MRERRPDEKSVGSAADDDPEGRTATTRLAVDVLREDQRDVLFRGAPDRDPALSPLTEPFDDRRGLINWWQAAAVRTFGHLAADFPATALLHNEHLVDALVGPDDAADAHLRQRLVELTLRAARRSYRDLEVRAEEWLTDSDDRSGRGLDYQGANPREQKHIAARPAFSKLDRQQARVLRRLWGGFDTREALAEWVHELPAVANTAVALDRPLDRWLESSAAARDYLLGEGTAARLYRERFAAGVLLSSFGIRARQLRAGESAAEGTDDRGDPQG